MLVVIGAHDDGSEEVVVVLELFDVVDEAQETHVTFVFG